MVEESPGERLRMRQGQRNALHGFQQRPARVGNSYLIGLIPRDFDGSPREQRSVCQLRGRALGYRSNRKVLEAALRGWLLGRIGGEKRGQSRAAERGLQFG